MDLAHWKRAGRALVRNLRETPGFASELGNSGLRADASPKASERHLFEAFPGAEGIEIDMGQVAYRRSNLDPYEQFALAVMARLRRPRRIFEIGTYDGATTLLLARVAPDAEIVTLDLPPTSADLASVADEARNSQSGQVGSRFAGRPERARIIQVLGDSRAFDFGPWYGAIDLVLVDAGHEYVAAKHDTATAFKLVSPCGIVVWDDYTVGWPGVVRAVDEAAVSVFRLSGTDFAIYDAATRR